MKIPMSFIAILAYILHFTNSQIINYENNEDLSRRRRLASDLEQNHDESSLSRKRRFSVPITGWTFETNFEFVLNIPLEGIDTSAMIKVPFQYKLDLSR